MFYALPAETVFEAKQRTRRATFYLFILLIALYIFFANLLTVSAYFFTRVWIRSRGFADLETLVLLTTLVAATVGIIHFFFVRAKSLDEMLDQIGTRPADDQDSYHHEFINLVSEAEAATGIHGIRPVVLPSPGCNAFSLLDGQGHAAIGATEGLLSKLTRQELSSVVAHEAAHLVHEDSRLVATACFLFAVFGRINSALGSVLRGTTQSTFGTRSSNRGGGGISGLILVLWIVSGIGYLVTRLISMAISREREYLADADGVAICKDPFALAESLYKISNRYRGDVPDAYSALFILNPSESALDDHEGFLADLFSNHPPVSKRLSKLLNWAQSDLKNLQDMATKEEETAESAAKTVKVGPQSNELGFMTYLNNQWAGPYTPAQLLALGIMTPATWVCPAGGQQVGRAADTPELLPLFQKQVQGSVSTRACPRCKVPLVQVQYEGTDVDQCSFCKGYLLRAGVLERMITREEVVFSPEDIKKAKTWRDSQRGPLKDRDHFPLIQCPYCGNPMGKGIHSMLTQVVIDHCTNDKCGTIWCDGGEMETIQMLVADAHAAPPS